MNTNTRKESPYLVGFVVMCPRTGRHLRDATSQEATAYRLANPERVWERPTMCGGVLVSAHYGPGVWFGGAGF